jgi:6-phosphogluconate dehydrogenase (decarboxylating)
MIEGAVILSGVVRHWLDFFIILLLLVSNAVVGFWEEHQAGNAIAALKAKLAIKARVKRDGKWITPAARELVPGDIIRVRLGDIVPADARLLEGDSVEVDQSALTGESLPATRKPGEAVFSGSIIRQGEIGALVYATGTNTYFGKTAQLVQEAHTVSHFQKAVLKIGNYLIILAVTLVAVIIAFAMFRGDAILTTLQFALVLTVAAIPVAMPTVLSVTMAVGARLLAKKEAIVSKLVAIEELAGVDLIFSKQDEETGKRLIDEILDVARQKGTGMWTSQSAMELQVPIPTIDLAVVMRDLSVFTKEREQACAIYQRSQRRFTGDRDTFLTQLCRALYAAMIITYAQALALLVGASNKYKYHLDLEAVARIWRGGCIIRAALLEDICAAFHARPELPNLLLDPNLSHKIMEHQEDLRQVVCQAAESGIPAPGLTVSLGYLDAYRSAWLPANLIQAQRDYFGAHTYERIDAKGTFHTEWEKGRES